jgi:phosphohistidine phosphatase SixA
MKKQETLRYTGKRLAICCLVIASLSTTAFPQTDRAATQSPMTVILVRHAEKAVVPPENKDPDLSAAGVARAEQIRKMFGDAGVAAIYATQFKRTQQTTKPLAEKLGLPVTQVEAKKTSDLVKQIRSQNAGQVIFIAGHNNTVPEIIAALGGPKLSIIPESEYDNLYILTVFSDGSTKLLKLKY